MGTGEADAEDHGDCSQDDPLQGTAALDAEDSVIDQDPDQGGDEGAGQDHAEQADRAQRRPDVDDIADQQGDPGKRHQGQLVSGGIDRPIDL